MKIILAIALTMFTIFMSYVFVGGFIQKQQKEDSTTVAPGPTVGPAIQSSSTNTFTVDQIAEHSSASDCWIIINQKVYSVGRFLGEHPGGASTILPYCGKEATKAFDTQDRGSGSSHSSNANNMLGDYLIGSLR